MSEKYLGVIDERESAELRKMFMRKNALKELFVTISSSETELYNKLINDIIESNQALNIWWQDVAQKYQWSFGQRDQWRVDFLTREIYIISE